MAQAIECDRCKKLIKNMNRDRAVFAGEELVVCVRVYNGWAREGDGQELCDKCLDLLVKKWLEKKSEGKV